jgi:hypothetical protein
LTKMCVGLPFGRFFHKTIWSPWPKRTEQLQFPGIRSSHRSANAVIAGLPDDLFLNQKSQFG